MTRREKAYQSIFAKKRKLELLLRFPCQILLVKKIKSQALIEKVGELLMLWEENPTLPETEVFIKQLNEKHPYFEVTKEDVLNSGSYLVSTMLRIRDPKMFEAGLEILQVEEILEKLNLLEAEMKRYLDKTDICNMRDDVTRYLDGQRSREVVRNLLQTTGELKDGLTVFFEMAVETIVLIEDLGLFLKFLDDCANKSPNCYRRLLSKIYTDLLQVLSYVEVDFWHNSMVYELLGTEQAEEDISFESIVKSSFDAETGIRKQILRALKGSFNTKRLVMEINDQTLAEERDPSGIFSGKGIRKDILRSLKGFFNTKRLVMEINNQTPAEEGDPSGIFSGEFCGGLKFKRDIFSGKCCGGLKFKREAEKTNGQKLGMEDSKLESTCCSSQGNSNQKDIVVGPEGMLKITARLIQLSQSGLEILTIVGMAGIGKSTLATEVFHNPIISRHFDCRAWVTVCENYKVKELFYDLLCSVSLTRYEKNERRTIDIAKRLNSWLKGKRYLIVMDNMSSVEAWDAVRQFFPDDKNESRILLTTRSVQLATAANPNNTIYCMNLLDEHQSWEFLKKKLFGIKSCPPELLDIGEQIAKKCLGLPSAIAHVANLLSRILTHGWWMVIENNLNSLVGSNPEKHQKILSLDFDQLFST